MLLIIKKVVGMNYNKILNLFEEIRLLEDEFGNSASDSDLEKIEKKEIELNDEIEKLKEQSECFKLSLKKELEFLYENVAPEKYNDLYYEQIEYLCNYMGNPVSRLGISERDIKNTINKITNKEQLADIKAFLKESDFDEEFKESVLMGKKSIFKSCFNFINRLGGLFSKLEIAAPIPGPYDSSCYASSCKSSDYHGSSQCAEATLGLKM